MSNSRSQINSNFYQIAQTDPTCGNITGISAANITAGYFFGNGYFLTDVSASGGYSNANVAAFLPTYTGNLAQSSDIIVLYANAATQSNAISAITGNVSILQSAVNILNADVANLELAQYSNANVANYLPVFGGNIGTGTGYIFGNGSQLSGLPATYSNANVAAYLSSDPNLNITVNGTVTADVFYGDVIGNIQGNFTVAGANTGVLFKDQGNANAVTGFVFDKTTNTVSIGANLTVGNVNSQYLYGNIRGTTGGYDDANVAAYLPTYTGNLQSGNLLVVNSVVIQGNLQVEGNTTFVNSNVVTIADKDLVIANGATSASQANGAGIIVGQGNLANIIFNNPANAWTFYPGVSTPGNVTGTFIIGDGSYLTNIQASNIIGGYGNAQVANYLQVLTSNITTTANVQAAYFLGNGSQLTGLPATYSNANVAAYLPVYGGNILGDVISGNIRAVSMLPAYANGQLANSDVDIGNVSHYFGNVFARALIVPPSNINNGFEIGVASGPGQGGAVFIDPSTGSAADIIAGVGFFDGLDVGGNIIADTWIEAPNVYVYDTLQTGNANVIGNLVAGNISNVNAMVANFYYGNGYYLSGIQASNLVGAYGNANVAAYLPTYTGNLASSSDIIALYANAATQSNAIANLQAAQYSNANVTNLLANGFGSNTIVTTGNITANYYFGNGAFLSGLNVNYSNANVANYLPTYSGNLGYVTVEALVSKQDIFANAGIEVNGLVLAGSFAGNGRNLFGIAYSNITGAYGNSNVASYLGSNSNVTIATTGNVSAGYFLGNGALLSGLNVNYSNANVANYLPTYSGNLGYVTVEALVSKQDIFANAGISVNGVVSAGSFAGNGRNLFGIAYSNITGAYSNANVANYLPTYTGDIGAGNITVTETIGANNIVATEDVSSNTMFAITLLTVGGNLIGGDADFGGNVSVGANIISNNVDTNGITAIGNVTAAYYFGNGSQLTGITTTATESFNPFLLAGM